MKRLFWVVIVLDVLQWHEMVKKQLNRKDVVALLIDRDADVDKADKYGRTPLCVAASV